MERLPGDMEHPPLPPPGEKDFDRGPHRPPPPGPPDTPLIVLDGDRHPIFGGPVRHDESLLKLIVVGTVTVGYAGFRLPPKQFLHTQQVRFLAQQKWILIVAGLGLVLVVTAFSLFLYHVIW